MIEERKARERENNIREHNATEGDEEKGEEDRDGAERRGDNILICIIIKPTIKITRKNLITCRP